MEKLIPIGEGGGNKKKGWRHALGTPLAWQSWLSPAIFILTGWLFTA